MHFVTRFVFAGLVLLAFSACPPKFTDIPVVGMPTCDEAHGAALADTYEVTIETERASYMSKWNGRPGETLPKATVPQRLQNYKWTVMRCPAGGAPCKDGQLVSSQQGVTIDAKDPSAKVELNFGEKLTCLGDVPKVQNDDGQDAVVKEPDPDAGLE